MDAGRLIADLTRAAGDPARAWADRLRLEAVLGGLGAAALALALAVVCRLLARVVGLDAALGLTALMLAGAAALVWRLGRRRAAARARDAAAARTALIGQIGQAQSFGALLPATLLPIAAFVAAFVLARRG